MTDEIRIEAEGAWTITVNGEEVASSDGTPVPPDPDNGFPPLLAVGSWSVKEDDRTPPVKVTFVPGNDFFMDPNFDYFFVCQEVGTPPADPTKSTPITSATEPTPRKGGERAPGTVIYSSVWVVSREDGTFQNATEGGFVLEQTLVGSGGNPVDWPEMPTALVDRALTFQLIKYGNKGNSNSNYGHKGTALLATIYAWNAGDRRKEVKDNIFAILSALTDPTKGPCGMNGPGAAQEAYALAWFHLLRRSDLWESVTTSQKKRIDAIFHALALIRAWEGNDGSASKGSWTITGMKGTDFRSIGPNIACSIPGQLTLCGEWFGYDALDAWLNQTTIAAVRSEVSAAFGATTGNLYLTLNWRNAGISAADEGAYYRSGPSSDAPTDSDINTSIRNLTYYGARFTKPADFLFPNPDRGLNKTMPPTKRTAGVNKWVGWNQHALNNNEGVQVSGKKRGYCIANGSKMPWLGEEGAMIYEMDGQDEGGLRSAMGYGFWTVYLTNCHLLPMVLNASSALEDPRTADFLVRWGKARDIMKHFDKNDYNSVCHISNKGGTGGPGPVIWSDKRDEWEPDINFFLWDTLLGAAA